MSVRLRVEQCCVVDYCSRPARELGGHCTPCWMGLADFERGLLRWEHEHQAVDALESLFGLPGYSGERREAA